MVELLKREVASLGDEEEDQHRANPAPFSQQESVSAARETDTEEGRLTTTVPEEGAGRRKGVKETREGERDDEVWKHRLVSF